MKSHVLARVKRSERTELQFRIVIPDIPGKKSELDIRVFERRHINGTVERCSTPKGVTLSSEECLRLREALDKIIQTMNVPSS